MKKKNNNQFNLKILIAVKIPIELLIIKTITRIPYTHQLKCYKFPYSSNEFLFYYKHSNNLLSYHFNQLFNFVCGRSRFIHFVYTLKSAWIIMIINWKEFANLQRRYCVNQKLFDINFLWYWIVKASINIKINNGLIWIINS